MVSFLHFDNVHIDENAEFGSSDLKETEYLQGLLESLRRRLPDVFSQYDFFIFAANGGGRIPSSASSASSRKVLIYLSDESSSYPGEWRSAYDAVFKCYLKQEHEGDNVYPIPLGCVDGFRPLPMKSINERSISVFFSGNLNGQRVPLFRLLTPYRLMPESLAREILRNRYFRKISVGLFSNSPTRQFENSYIKFTRGFMSGLSRGDFVSTLYNSRIAICPPGFDSPETFRHFEAMRAGCVVISLPLPDTWIYRNSPIVQVPNWSQGLNAIHDLLASEHELVRLHNATTAWWENRCSEEAVAKYMAERLSSPG